MSEIIGEAIVLVRPDTTGFEAAATPGVEKAGKGLGSKLGKAMLGAFAVAGVYEGIKSVVEAATAQNTAFAVLDQTLKNAGLSVKGFSASLHDTLEVQARRTGVSAEDLAAAMNRLIPATHDAKESLKDLNTAIGISEAYHISLSTAALALAKAETGSFNSLQRYLGKIPQVTTAQDALKARYQGLLDQNIKLDASDKAKYANALAIAKAQDAQATATQALATATQKFSGIPQTFANTYAGQFARLHVAVEQLKVAVGTELVGGLAKAAGGLSDFLGRLLESNDVQKLGASISHNVGEELHTIGQVAEVIGPPLLAAAKAVQSVASAIGAPALLAGVAAFKAVGVATGVAGSAQLLYAKAIQASAGATTAAVVEEQALTTEATQTTISMAALTDAIIANTASLAANDTAVGESIAIYNAYGAVLSRVALESEAAVVSTDALAASTVAAGTAGEAAAVGGLGAFVSGLGELGVGAIASPAGIAIGVTALAVGITYLLTKQSAWAASNKAVTGSLQGLTSATQQQHDAVGRLAKQAAAENLTKQTEKAVEALSNLGQAATNTTLPNVHSLGPGSIVPGATAANLTLQNQAQAQEKLALQTGRNEIAVRKFLEALGQQSLKLGQQNPLLSHNLDLLGQLAEKVGHVPSKIDIQLLIDNKDPKATLQEVEAGLDGFAQFVQGVKNLASGAILKGSLDKVFSQVNSTVAGAQALATKGAAVAAKKAALTDAEQSLKDSLASDKYDIQSLNQQIADAVRTGAQAVIDSVNQAKQNLNSIGQALAQQIGTLIDMPITIASKKLSDQQDRITQEFDKRTAALNAEGQRLTTESDRLSLANSKLTLKNLQQGVLLPGGKQLSADPQKAIAQLEALEKRSGSRALRDYIAQYRSAFIGEQQGENGLKRQIIGERKARLDSLNQIKNDSLKVAQDTADGRKTILTKELADLTDQFNSHEITKGQLSARVADVLRENGVTRARAVKILGQAGADALFADVTGLGQQAAASAAGPQRAGNGLIPTIVRPLQTLHDQQREINRLRHEEFVKEHDEQKKQTKLLKDIANGKAADKFTSSLDKNPGSASKKTQKLSGATR